MLFAGVGYNVVIYDIEPKQLESALVDIKEQLNTHEKTGMLRGNLSAKSQYELIKCKKYLNINFAFQILRQLNYLNNLSQDSTKKLYRSSLVLFFSNISS